MEKINNIKNKLIILFLILFLSGCFLNEKLKIDKVELIINKKLIKANGVDKVILTGIVKNKYGDILTNYHINYYVNGQKIENNFFSTDKSGKYILECEVEEIRSKSIEVEFDKPPVLNMLGKRENNIINLLGNILDIDGKIKKFQIDWENDGEIDEEIDENFLMLNLNHSYNLGDKTIELKIIAFDDKGLSTVKTYIFFYNKHFENVIKAKLDIPENRNIYYEDLKQIKNLLIYKFDLIEELKYFTNLKTLYIESVENKTLIKFIIPKLDYLNDLTIENCRISDFSFLKNIKNLERLNLEKDDIENFNVDKYIKNLKELDIMHNKINNIEKAGNLKKLEKLYLPYLENKDFEFIKKLNNLKELYLIGDDIEDISFLGNLKHLEKLDLSENSIKNILPLADMVNLKELNLEGNLLEDISSIENLTKLEKLYLSGNQLKDISKLDKLTALKILDLKFNEIIKLDGLDDLKNLEELIISNNKIDNLFPIVNLMNLRNLKCSYNKIKEISYLHNMTNLENLYADNNLITDLRVMLELNSLKYLNIKNNPIYGNAQINNYKIILELEKRLDTFEY
ncbi:leucine-rich repeat domain-containing protein [Haliovirga abyssi]|nr:leucine-rich repeat domain-containing protein [Haliovirga abyssi]